MRHRSRGVAGELSGCRPPEVLLGGIAVQKSVIFCPVIIDSSGGSREAWHAIALVGQRGR
eukprot:4204076-Alexandrium_andersonii.AAC.1